MPAVFSLVDRRTTLGLLLLDVLVTEEAEFENYVTVYPVEDGTVISDHISQGSRRLKISGLISTADAGGGFGIAATFGLSTDRSAKLVDVLELLEQMHLARELIDVSTGQLIYRNMAFTRLSAKRSNNEGGGNWVSVDAEMINIRKVSLKNADVPPAEQVAPPASGRAGGTNTPAGANGSGPAQGAGRGRSALVSIRSAVQGSPAGQAVLETARNALPFGR